MRNHTLVVPQRGMHRFRRQCGERCLTNKVLGIGGHDGGHMRTRIDQIANEFYRLVRSDSAAYTDNNKFA